MRHEVTVPAPATPTRSPWPCVVLVAVVGLAGATAATMQGIGVTPDSVVYLDAAEHLAAGDGYVSETSCDAPRSPVVRYPPLFSIVLAAFVAAGFDTLQGARVIGVVMLAANALILAAAARHVLPGAFLPPVGAALFMVTSPVMLEVHSAVWSEQLFIFFTVAGLLALQLHRDKQRLTFLLAASLAFAGALLTRYMGLAAIVTAGVVLLFNRRARLGRRLRDMFICCLASALPAAPYLLRQATVARPARRGMIEWEHAQALFVTLGSWLAPGSDRITYFPGQDGVLTAVGLALLLMTVWPGGGDREVRRSPMARRPVVFETFALVYMGLLLTAIGVGSRGTPLDNRMLSPVFPAVLIIALHRADVFARVGGLRLRQLMVAGGIGLASAYAVAAIAIVVYVGTQGRGYTSSEWRYDEIVAAIGRLDRGTPIFSDEPRAVKLFTGRPACKLPGTGATDVAGVLRQHFGHRQVAVVRMRRPRRFPPRLEASRRSRRAAVDLAAVEDLELRLLVKERDAELYLARFR